MIAMTTKTIGLLIQALTAERTALSRSIDGLQELLSARRGHDGTKSEPPVKVGPVKTRRRRSRATKAEIVRAIQSRGDDESIHSIAQALGNKFQITPSVIQSSWNRWAKKLVATESSEMPSSESDAPVHGEAAHS